MCGQMQKRTSYMTIQRSKIRLGLMIVLAMALVFSTLLVGRSPVRAAERVGLAKGFTNVHGGPGRGFWIIDTLRRNEAIPVIGISADGGFWHVRTARGNGFVLRDALTVTGDAALPTVQVEPFASITAGQASIRRGPGVDAAVITALSRGSQFYVIGRSPDNAWVQIRFKFGEGWVKRSLTSLSSEGAGGLPAGAATPTLIINTPFLNLRSGPGNEYSSIMRLRGGQTYAILGVSANGAWYYINTDAGRGWVNKIYVITRNYFGGAPIVNAPPASEAAYAGRVITGAAAVRSGPGTAFNRLGVIAARTEVAIIGQSPDRGWWLVRVGTLQGWVSRELIRATPAANNVKTVNP
jgi:uncharacterized protein YgiM (DUF1202 family)